MIRWSIAVWLVLIAGAGGTKKPYMRHYVGGGTGVILEIDPASGQETARCVYQGGSLTALEFVERHIGGVVAHRQ